MLAEWKMPTNAWPRLAPLVQMILNNTPVDSLGGKARIIAMTGRVSWTHWCGDSRLSPPVLTKCGQCMEWKCVICSRPREISTASWRRRRLSIDVGERKANLHCQILRWGTLWFRQQWWTQEEASFESCERGRCGSYGQRARGFSR
jgi:hypothetical protein